MLDLVDYDLDDLGVHHQLQPLVLVDVLRVDEDV